MQNSIIEVKVALDFVNSQVIIKAFLIGQQLIHRLRMDWFSPIPASGWDPGVHGPLE